MTTVAIVASDATTDFHVIDENCFEICDNVTTACTFDHTGTVTVLVHGGIGPYTLVTTTGPVPTISAPPPGECNVLNAAGVCVNIATGEVIQRATVYSVALGSSGSHQVVGSVQQWRFPLPGGGSVVLPCVVLSVNSLGNGGCAAAGGTYAGTTAVLVNQSVPQPTVGFGDALLSIGVCEAAVTVTAAGFGVEDFPLVTVC